ncbi:MAG: dihydroorotate dehydrogenase electron transfer subunit [Candidatus Neomarinimicrobiota bacterium]
MLIEQAQVRSNQALARGLFSMELLAPGIAAVAHPGQFVNILVSTDVTPLLRRPMSVASVEGDTFGLIYKLFGQGTRQMSRWSAGQQVNILGPLGNGWSIPENGLPVLVGGGVGIAPIFFLHKHLLAAGRRHLLIMGARDKSEHFLEHNPSGDVILTTDDGSLGVSGSVIAGLEVALVSTEEPVSLLGCGPPAMLKALQVFALEQGLACQLAVEEMMGCGFGICMGCSVEVSGNGDSPPEGDSRRFKLACVHGPVFPAGELVL